jgi:hypothetical protein
MGQLKGVAALTSGACKRGQEPGLTCDSRPTLEIHGTRLSLYAGDGGRLQVSAVDVIFYRTGSASSTLAPDADGAAINVETTGANYFGVVNEGANAPNHNTYISNTPNMSGSVLLSLSNPAAFTSIFRVDIKAALRSTGLSNDTVSIYGQVFASDLITPLTGEVLLATRTSNTTATVTVTAPHEGYGTVITADWTGARLRLRWEYAINANEEAIRLDPSIPSLAVGNPLPTGPQTGGDGFWTGAFDGGYVLRIGGALNSAPQLLYNGASGRLAFRSTTGEEKIVLDVDGSAYFGGAMTIGASGGIWQGTGSFASPTTGLKIYNSSGVGRLSTYNAGLEQITLNTSGQLVAGAGAVVLDRSGLQLIDPTPGAGRASEIRFRESVSATRYGYIRGGGYGFDLGIQLPSARHALSMMPDGVYLRNGDSTETSLLVSNGAVVIDNNAANATLFVSGVGGFAGDTIIGGGLAIGDVALDPLTGVLLMKERTAATTATPADTAQIWVQDVAGVQKFYIKFANGTQRELATA